QQFGAQLHRRDGVWKYQRWLPAADEPGKWSDQVPADLRRRRLRNHGRWLADLPVRLRPSIGLGRYGRGQTWDAVSERVQSGLYGTDAATWRSGDDRQRWRYVHL